MRREDEDGLIGRIYDAALDGTLWPEVLDRLRNMVDCRAGALMHGTLQPVAVTFKGAVGMDRALVERAQEIFGDASDNPFIVNLPALSMGQPVPRQDFIDDETFERHRIYRDFFEPQDLFHDITTPVTIAPDEAVALYLGRERRAGPLGEREGALLLPWIPHIQRALLIDRQLRMHRAGSHALVEILDRIACGVVLTGPDGAVMLMNGPAERMIGAGDGLELRERRFQASSRTDNAELGNAVDMAATGQGGGSLLVGRPSGARAYLVFTVPLSSALAANWSQAPVAAIIFSDPEDSVEPPPGVLAQLYGLSPAETAVALETAKGLGLDAVATKLGVSRNTAKTHLHRVFSKTGTSRQAELVRLLLTNRGFPAND